ncbi:DUF6356 family protein [Sphingopyxis sp.]|uniref:DUF6356 family protein n=1 Tax=Sphingopyxis sp. TaxID=1908224 RepID=UPI003D6CEBB1
MLRKLFTEHPATVGESYFRHFSEAASFSGAMLVGSIACLIHALVPGLCVRTGSGIIAKLHDRMIVNRAPRRSIGE